MDTQKRQAFEHILRNQNVTLVELLDHLLLKGVMAKGEIVLTVADVDLVYLNLGLLLSSVQTVVSAAGDAQPVWRTDLVDQQAPLSVEPPAPTLPGEKVEGFPHSQSQPFVPRYEPPTAESEQPEQEEHARKVEKSLIRLVLLLVNVLRELMEKQAIRRMEANQLTAQEVERIGTTFFLLKERIDELKTMFELSDNDLNLDLGPLWHT